MELFAKVTSPEIFVYDAVTGEPMSNTQFALYPDIEKALLDLVNYYIVPPRLLVRDLTIQPMPYYIPPTTEKPLKRMGVLKGLFTDAYSQELNPVEIRIKYDVRARGNLRGSEDYFDSVECSNIELQGIRY